MDGTAFVQDEVVKIAAVFAASLDKGAAERDRAGAIPRQQLAVFDNSGLAAASVPPAYGGNGLGPRALAEITRLIAGADPAIAQIPQGHYLAVDILNLLGNDAQKRRIYPSVAGGGRIALVLAERGGRHAQDLQTTLVHEDGRYWLEGKKYYSTGAATSRWLAVSALDPLGRLVLVFVDRDSAGISVDEDWNAMGQRATVSGTTVLDKVPVDPNLVVPYWSAFEGPQVLGARAQLVHAAIEAGIAEGALADAGRFVRTKSRPFFEAVRTGAAPSAADDPHTLLRFGELTTRVTAAVQLLRWAADVAEGAGLNLPSPEAAARVSIAVAQAKAFASEVAVDTASKLFALTGASGTDRRWNLDRHWRNARTHSVHDPVDWKYHHIGAWELTRTLPPNHGQL